MLKTLLPIEKKNIFIVNDEKFKINTSKCLSAQQLVINMRQQ